MKIIVAGIIGRYPWGGVTWCSLMYLIGLRQLGHDVYYLEDTCECNFDPEINSPATDPSYALRYIQESLQAFGFGDRWHYIDFLEKTHGMSDSRWKEVCASADLLLVLSGGVWKWRDEYLRIPRRAFIDSDPAFTQLSVAQTELKASETESKGWFVEYFQTYDHLFTFGGNIGSLGNEIPVCGFQWNPTTQPICTDLWTPEKVLPPRPVYTTVMTWQIESFTVIGGNKDQEFLKILGLASRCDAAGGPPLELAVNGPREFLSGHGWRCVEAHFVSADPWRYHAYITSSRGEFSVAKHTYVSTDSGWFSDRTACYLAAGKPAVVQETGQSRWLPTGSGLLTWRDEAEAFDQLQRVEKDYAFHSKASRDLAQEYLAAEKVLEKLLNRCMEM